MRIRPALLTTAQIERLNERLLELVGEFWRCMPPDYLMEHYFDRRLSACDGCLLMCGDTIVGFQLISSTPVDLGGERYTVLRSVVCKTRGLTGRHHRSFDTFGPRALLRQALAAYLRGRTPWIVEASSGPVTYHRIADVFSTIMPSPSHEKAADRATMATFEALADAVGIRLDPQNPFTTQDAPFYVMTEQERRSWHSRSDPTVRRFIETCPGFGKGQKMIFAVPLTLSALAGIVPRLLLQRWKRRRSRSRATREPVALVVR